MVSDRTVHVIFPIPFPSVKSRELSPIPFQEPGTKGTKKEFVPEVVVKKRDGKEEVTEGGRGLGSPC